MASSRRMSRCVTVAHEITQAGLAALGAEHGARRVSAALAERSLPRVRRVLAVGKAAPAMAEGAFWAMGDQLERALIVCKEPPPPGLPPRATVLLAGHPRPDERSVIATEAALRFCAENAAEDDLLVLLSGGTSALIGGPVAGTSLASAMSVAELSALTDSLLRSGLDITAINAERRRLGAALGGRLASATRGRRIVALVLSDVLGGDLRTIGSGPLHGDPLDPRVEAEILADPGTLQRSAAQSLASRGFSVKARASLVQGEVGRLVDELARAATTLAPGEALVATGEPTLRVTGSGRGGRATHAALLLAERLAGAEDVAALALASDGSDGPTELAGAVVSGETAAQAARLGVSLADARARFDSGAALDAIGCALRTGPTGTNLTDLYVIARAR